MARSRGRIVLKMWPKGGPKQVWSFEDCGTVTATLTPKAWSSVGLGLRDEHATVCLATVGKEVQETETPTEWPYDVGEIRPKVELMPVALRGTPSRLRTVSRSLPEIPQPLFYPRRCTPAE